MARNLAKRLSFSVIPVAPTIERPLPASPGISGADTRSLPRQRALLSWLFAARTLLAVGTLLAAALVWTRTPDVSFIFSIAVLVTLVATAYGWWRVRIRGGEIGSLFLVGQALADLGLVTTLVHYASAPAIFASLYVLVIAGYAVLLPPQLGVLVTVCATDPLRVRHAAGRLVGARHGVLGAGRGVQRGVRDRGGAGPPPPRGGHGAGDARHTSSSGCGSRPTTSCGTSGRAC